MQKLIPFLEAVAQTCSAKKMFLTTLTEKNHCILLNSVQERLCLAPSDLFHMFTQSVKFYTFYHHILKSADVWNL